MKRVFIVHGYTGNPEKNWFPWLKNELQNKNIQVEVPAMPHSDAPEFTEWLSHLRGVIVKPDKDTYLVGHSLGCPTILRYLEGLDDSQDVGGVLLVAGFAEPLPHLPELNSFTEDVWHDEKIKRHKLVIINSGDDQAVPFEYGERVKNRFDAELIRIENAGHINEKSGHTAVPFVLEKLLGMMA